MAFTRVLGPGIHTASNINSHNINSTGIITAVSFVGDGSSLTGVANTDFIVGTAITMGTANFTGNVTIGGTLTYEDVKNVDSVGLITARSGVVFQGNATFGNNVKSVYNSNLEIYNDGSNRFKGNSGGMFFGLPGAFQIKDQNFSNTRFEAGGTHATLYSAGAPVARSHEARFEVGNADVGIGIAATITTSGDARFAGIITATAFKLADGSAIGAGAGGTWSSYTAGIATSKSVGVNTSNLDDNDLVGVGNSFQGLYISNGMMITDNKLSGNHYIGTAFNGLMAGPVNIEGTLTIDGNYVVV